MKLKTIIKNKKADAGSFLIMIIMFAVFSIVAIFFSYLIGSMYSGLSEDSDLTENTEINNTLDSLENLRVYSFDYMIVFYIFGSMIALLIGSIFLNYHPVWMVVFLFVTIFGVFLAMQVTNIYDEFRTDSELGATVTEHSISNLILGRYFPLIIFVTGCLSMIILYGKRNAGSQHGA